MWSCLTTTNHALRHQKDVVACGHLDLLVSASAVQA